MGVCMAHVRFRGYSGHYHLRWQYEPPHTPPDPVGHKVIEASVCMEWEGSMRRAFGITIFAVLVAASIASSVSGTLAGLAAYKEQRVLATLFRWNGWRKNSNAGNG